MPEPSVAAAVARLDELTRRLRRECPWDREQDERSIVPAHGRGGLRARRRRQRGRRRQARATSSATCSSRSTSSRCCSRSAAPGDMAQVAEHCPPEAHPPPPARLRRGRSRDRRRGAAQLGRDQARRARPRGGHLRRGAREPARPCCYARKVQRRAAPAGLRLRRDVPYDAGQRGARGARGRRHATATRVFHEVGDLLFAAVNVARKLRVDPELALRAAERPLPRARSRRAEALAARRRRRMGRADARRPARPTTSKRG